VLSRDLDAVLEEVAEQIRQLLFLPTRETTGLSKEPAEEFRGRHKGGGCLFALGIAVRRRGEVHTCFRNAFAGGTARQLELDHHAAHQRHGHLRALPHSPSQAN
jgi:hypothetical protein